MSEGGARELILRPIGVVRSPFAERVDAPRQAVVAADVEGTIELRPGHDFEHALSDLEGWEMLWVVYWFDRNEGWKPKVQPPRDSGKRGVFATRSPHRPNPIGLSAVKLLGVEGLTVHVRGIDMLDGTPVLDLKPYVPYADAFPRAATGWLANAGASDRESATDPRAAYEVVLSPLAEAQLAFLKARAVDLEPAVRRSLALGPQPQPYRRIREDGDGFRLAIKDWRLRFLAKARVLTVERFFSGYRPSEVFAEGVSDELRVHRDFVERFG